MSLSAWPSIAPASLARKQAGAACVARTPRRAFGLTSRATLSGHCLRAAFKGRDCHVGRARAATVCAAAAENYYTVLGVEKNADLKTIKSAYRKMALKYHPDVNKAPDATARFTQLKEAFNVLSDQEQRAKYDRQQRGGFGGFSGGGGGSRSSDASDFDFMNYKRAKTKQDEDWYGITDFFRDLDKEIVGRKGSSDGRVKSLWEELSDVGMSIGGEFVEFLESGLSGLEDPVKSQSADSRGQYTDTRRGGPSGSAGGAGGRAGASAASDAGAVRKPPPPPPPPKKQEESVDDLLKKMKKEMGLE